MNNQNESIEKNLGWMYEGAKSSVNREDYLLGKKVDKNFELYSDVVIKDKDEDQKTRFFKEKLLSESLTGSTSKTSALDVNVIRNEDPLVALKMQEDARRRQVLENPLTKLKIQRILKKEFEKERHKKRKKASKRRSHSRQSYSSSSSEGERQKRKEHYEKKNAHEKYSHQKHNTSYRHTKGDAEYKNHKTSNERKSKKLSAEEMDAKRREMMSNVAWRDNIRNDTVKKAQEKLKKEEEEAKRGVGPTFIRTMLTSSGEQNLESRLQTKRMNLQRSHDYMEKPFSSRK